MLVENETPRASRLRTTPSCDIKEARRVKLDETKKTEPLEAQKPTINRNGSVMKLAQNFTTISQTGNAAASRPISPVHTVADPGAFTTPESSQQWTSGEILNRHFDHLKIPLTGRPSVQKIRSENHGKVSAHVRKFDRMASPTFPEGRCPTSNPSCTTENSTDATPVITQRVRSPRKCSIPQRQLSDSHAVKERSTSPKVTQISPLRESQRANAIPQSARGHSCDVKVERFLKLKFL